MFYIKLGYTTDNTYKVNKSWTEISPSGGVPINMYGDMNILSPVFEIMYNAAYLDVNYVYAEFLRRYYMVTGPITRNGDRLKIPCSVDYLSSFDLSECPITCYRNGGIGSPTLIPDNKLPILPNTVDTQDITVYNNKLDQNANYSENRSYVLCTVSGGIAPESRLDWRLLHD